MGFTKETASKAGKKSSRKGRQNKTTAEIKEAFQKLIVGNLDNLDAWIKEIAQNDPAKAFDLILKISDYVVPKLTRQEFVTGFQDYDDVMNMSEEERDARIKELLEKAKKSDLI